MLSALKNGHASRLLTASAEAFRAPTFHFLLSAALLW